MTRMRSETRAHDGEVVADEDIGEPVRRLQVAQELDDVLLDRAVERRGRLVEDDEPRVQDHRPRDRDALALAARELVREAIAPGGVEPHLLEGLRGAPVALPARDRRLVDEEALGDDLARRHARRQRAVGVLEDDLEPAPQGAHRGAVERREVAVLEAQNRSSLPGRRHELQDRAPERRLAGAGFADDADGLAGPDRKIDAVDGADRVPAARKQPAAQREGDAHVAGLEHHRRVRRRRRLAAARLGLDQPARVGMARAREDLRRVAALDHLAVAHDVGAGGEAAHDAEVVGDEHHRHAEARLQVGEKRQDARLDRDVERRRRLVGDEEIGVVRDRHGDHHALALAARELVRVGRQPAFRVGDAHEVEELDRPRPGLAPRQAAMGDQRQRDLVADPVERIERGHRLLEDHRDLGAADAVQRRRREPDELRRRGSAPTLRPSRWRKGAP